MQEILKYSLNRDTPHRIIAVALILKISHLSPKDFKTCDSKNVRWVLIFLNFSFFIRTIEFIYIIKN